MIKKIVAMLTGRMVQRENFAQRNFEAQNNLEKELAQERKVENQKRMDDEKWNEVPLEEAKAEESI